MDMSAGVSGTDEFIMKKLFYYISIFFILIFSSCNNSPKNNPVGLSCEINGKVWKNSEENVKIEFKEDGYKIWALNGDPVKGPFETIILYFQGSMKLKEYSIATDSISNYAIYNTDIEIKDKKNMNDFDSYKAISGKITITKIDKIHIEGLFDFIANNSKTQKKISINNGKFSLRFPD